MKLHDYQDEALGFMLQRDAAALFADPGLGKTAIALHLIDALKLFYGARALVVAPLRPLVSTWPDEIEKWTPGLSWRVYHGRNKSIDPSKDVHLVNPEGLGALISEPGARKAFDVLVVDESSKFKNWSAKRTKLLRQFRKCFRWSYILTGTPAPQSLLDLFAQIYLVDQGATFGRAYTRFRSNYFKAEDYFQRDWKPKEGAEAKIWDAVGPLALRLDGEKLLDLPPLVSRDMVAELPNTRREEYERIEKKLFAQIQAGGAPLTLTGDDSAYALCRQFSSGFTYRKTITTANGEVVQGRPGWHEAEAAEIEAATAERRKPRYGRAVIEIHDTKLDMLRELCGELQGKPLVVIYNWVWERDAIQKTFGPGLPCLGAHTSAEQGREIVQQWNRGEIRMLLAHPASASHGLNLQKGPGRHMVWFSLTDNLDHYIQMNRRIRRQGVDSKVFIYHLVLKNTVDQAIKGTLEQKDKTQNALLDALERYKNAHCH